MKIGYVRVSKQEQHEALQIDALKEAGCEKWFIDKMTGSKAESKGLDEALAYLRPGDTFVVWKLDRAGRSLTHLIELLKGLKERDIEFISLTEQIDTTTPGGKLIFHLMGVFAHINGTHFTHESEPTRCKMIIKNGPTPTPHLCSRATVKFVRSNSPIAGIISSRSGPLLMINISRVGPLYGSPSL